MNAEEKKNLVELNDAEVFSNESSVENNQNKSLENFIPESDLNKNVEKSKPKQSKNDQISRDYAQINRFLSPMLDDLDKLVATHLKEMDKLEDEMLAESKIKPKNEVLAHIPKEIREKKPIESILKGLESMIIEATDSTTHQVNDLFQNNQNTNKLLKFKSKEKLTENKEEKVSKINDDNILDASPENITNEETKFDFYIEPAVDIVESKLSKINNIACLAHSLTAYLITVNKKNNSEKLKNLTVKLYDSVNLWISRLFRFYDSSILFHDQESDGLTRMCNMLFNFKYTTYKSNGYQSINKQPLIYISAASKYAHIDYRELISIQLGMPLSSIKLVNVLKTVDTNLDKIDIQSFLNQLEDDVKNGFCPVALIANSGSHNVGQCDDIQELNQICYKYKIWLHLEGIYLSTLILYSVPTAIQPVLSGDSITINLADWLGVPSLSYITIYKNVPNSGAYIQPFNSYLSTLQKCLPYWCVLQALGHQGVMQRIKYAIDLCNYITDLIQKQSPYLKILNFKRSDRPEAKLNKYTISDLVAKALSFLTYVELNNSILIFKCDQNYIKERLFFAGKVEKTESAKLKEDFVKMIQDIEPLFPSDMKKLTKEEEPKDTEHEEQIKEYTDTLTTWLCDLMNSLHKTFEFELIEIGNEGICIRYSPLEHANLHGTTENDIDNFQKSLEDVIEIMDASIKSKITFDQDIKNFKNLLSVSVPKWAGIGAVRYIPDYLLDKLDDISYFLKEKKNNENQATNLLPESINEIDSKSKDLIDFESNDNQSLAPSDTESTADSVKTVKINKSINNNNELEKDVEEIVKLNEKLLKELQTQDGAFSIGEASDGIIAIKFGMVDDVEAVVKLAGQIQKVGKEVEESIRYIEVMSELIKQGIDKANEDLKKENEQKMIQEGILRHIPIVSDVFNWFAPAENVNVIGRTFNLQSGKIATTEVIHKYHMQINDIDNKLNESDSNSLNANMDSDEKTDGVNDEQIKVINANGIRSNIIAD